MPPRTSWTSPWSTVRPRTAGWVRTGRRRLDNNNKANPNGYFDYVEGYTVSNGRVFFPKAEPFGQYLKDYLVTQGVSADKAEKYAFTELYDTTKTAANHIRF